MHVNRYGSSLIYDGFEYGSPCKAVYPICYKNIMKKFTGKHHPAEIRKKNPPTTRKTRRGTKRKTTTAKYQLQFYCSQDDEGNELTITQYGRSCGALACLVCKALVDDSLLDTVLGVDPSHYCELMMTDMHKWLWEYRERLTMDGEEVKDSNKFNMSVLREIGPPENCWVCGMSIQLSSASTK